MGKRRIDPRRYSVERDSRYLRCECRLSPDRGSRSRCGDDRKRYEDNHKKQGYHNRDVSVPRDSGIHLCLRYNEYGYGVQILAFSQLSVRHPGMCGHAHSI